MISLTGSPGHNVVLYLGYLRRNIKHPGLGRGGGGGAALISRSPYAFALTVLLL